MAEELEPIRRRKRATRPDGSFYSSDPKERHAQLVEDGKLGARGSELARQHGARGGRPRKPRAAEILSEWAREEADQIKQAFIDALDDEQPIRIRMEAARAVLDIERGEASIKLDEDKFDNITEEEVDDRIAALMEDPMIRAALGAATPNA